MAIYENIDDEINEAYEFLREGLSRNEAVMILTEDVGKHKLLKRIKENESVLGGNIEELQKRGNVTIESTSGWYFPDGTTPNPDRIIATFTAMVDFAINNGKKAIRIFGDMSAFFKDGFAMNLLDYSQQSTKPKDSCDFLSSSCNLVDIAISWSDSCAIA